MNNKIITSKGPNQDITIINRINLEKDFVKNVNNDKLDKLKQFLLAPKKFACVPIKENKIPVSSITLEEHDVIDEYDTLKEKTNEKSLQEELINQNIKKIINENCIKVLPIENYLNNYYAVYMNKIKDYLNTYNNDELEVLTTRLLKLSQENIQMQDKKNNISTSAGYVNFSLLFISICFLSFLSVLLGLLILGK